MKNKDFSYPDSEILEGDINDFRNFWYKFMLEVLINRNSEFEIRRRIKEKIGYDKYKEFIFHKPFIYYKQFDNLSVEVDGNPVYCCNIDTINRKIRVIHEKSTDSSVTQIGAWISEAINGGDELVMSLEANNQSLLYAEEITYCWLCDSLEKKDVEYILEYLLKDIYEELG
ncbi:hypothetical protein [Marinomonas fungiae]|uniref:hypothetical protein n=1 Tax=Marinomonas fungiae TaxID=1137284 RepID=UPI003A91CFB0